MEQQARELCQRVTGRTVEDWDSIFQNRRVAARKSMKVMPGVVLLPSTMSEYSRFYNLTDDDFERILVTRDGGYDTNPYVQKENEQNGDDPDPVDIPNVEDVSDYLWKRYDDGMVTQPQKYQGRCNSFFAYRIRLDRFEKLFPYSI